MQARPNNYILFHPDTPHGYRSDQLFVNDWLHADDEQMEQFLRYIQFPLNTLVEAVQPPFVSRSLMELQRIHRSDGELSNQIIDYDLRSFLMKLSHWQQRSIASSTIHQYYLPLSELRNELYNAPQRHRSVEELAYSVNLSKSYFQHTYKQLFGCPVTHDIINGRLDYAKYLLTNSPLPVYHIAKICGYDNETHFMRQFKKFVGVTPSTYRIQT